MGNTQIEWLFSERLQNRIDNVQTKTQKAGAAYKRRGIMVDEKTACRLWSDIP